MTAIIWKEIREHLKWAVLWLLAMGVALAVVLYNERTQSVCAGSFLGVLAFGGALGGTLLALAQILPEIRRGQWAFLVHRPATRTSLFLGKVIGGLLLYFLAMGVPLLAAAIWAATPGALGAPFEARMVLPGVANILAGVLFYFAGLLTGLRPVRWYGSRALPLVVALSCLGLVAIVPEFWIALLVIIVGGTVLALAAWGSFRSAGTYASQPRRAKVALGIVMLGGIAAVWLVLALLAAEHTPYSGASWTHYEIDDEGRVILVTDEYGAAAKVTDLQGNEVERYRDPKVRSTIRGHLLSPAYLLLDWHWGGGGYQDSDRYLFELHAPGDFAWYYVFHDARIWGYSKKDRRFIGSIGIEGFAPAGSTPGPPFPSRLLRSPWSHGGLLAFPAAAYRVDLITRAVSTLCTANAGQEILGAATFTGTPLIFPSLTLAIATREEILILENDGQPRFKLRHPCAVAQYNAVRIAATVGCGRYFIWYSLPSEGQMPHGITPPDYIVELAADGGENRRYELPAIRRFVEGPRWPQVLWAAGVPLLGVLCGVAFDALSDSAFAGTQVGLGVLLGGPSVEYSPASALNGAVLLAFAVGSAAIGLCLARRYAFPKAACVGWTLAGFLLGTMGVLTLLALRDWPAREPCPACGKLGVVDRDACEHCGAPFPAPVPDGTEIFEC